jgi:hypothetical protein
VFQSFRSHPVCLLPPTDAQTLPASTTLQAQPGEVLISEAVCGFGQRNLNAHTSRSAIKDRMAFAEEGY